MKTLVMILQILPALIEAVKAVEGAWPEGGEGKRKLGLILGVLDDVPDDLSSLIPVVEKTVARIVQFFNALKVFEKPEDAGN